MRLSDCILCVLIYCNLPGLLHRNAGSVRFPWHAEIWSVHRRPVRHERGGEYYRKWYVLFVLLRPRKNNLQKWGEQSRPPYTFPMNRDWFKTGYDTLMITTAQMRLRTVFSYYAEESGEAGEVKPTSGQVGPRKICGALPRTPKLKGY